MSQITKQSLQVSKKQVNITNHLMKSEGGSSLPPHPLLMWNAIYSHTRS